jgi:hypothetical protein
VIKQRVDGVEGRLGRIESRLDGLDRAFKEFAKNLSAIIGDAVREAWRYSES